MVPLEKVDVSIDSGIAGDYRGKADERQVTIVDKEAWDDVCKELGMSLSWISRRANLMVEGIPLEDSRGKFIRVGNLWLKVTGECKPCSRMDQVTQGLKAILTPFWRGGVTCQVVEGGTIHLGDEVEIRDQLE